MPTPAHSFDTKIAAWMEWQQAPWGRLRYDIARANLSRHLEQRPLHILDADGGNGLDSIPLAVDGHYVTVLDYSHEMLAEAQRTAQLYKVDDRVRVHHTDVAAIPTTFPSETFDVVLCHNVLQYVDDAQALLQAVCSPLRQDGLLSLMSINRYSESYRAVFQQNDFMTALSSLDTTTTTAQMFDVEVRRYASSDLVQPLHAVGCTVLGEYGIRCVYDYLPNEQKEDAAFAAHLEQLENRLTDTYPYYLLARFFQIIARKTTG